MITERTLKNWRREALKAKQSIELSVKEPANRFDLVLDKTEALLLYKRILRMTQLLLDQHLLRK